MPFFPDGMRRGGTVPALVLIVLHVAVLVALAADRPWTLDESPYLQVGAALRTALAWDGFHSTLHGPLPFFANQLFADWWHPYEPWQEFRFYGRLGMLPFAVIAAWCTFALARDAFGPRAGLAALILHGANPVVLANACLMTADSALMAMQIVTVCVAHGYLKRPTGLRLVGVGIALGLALATKYLAVLLVPILLFALLASPLRRRLFVGVPVVALVALLTLHGSYLYRVPGYEVRTPPPGVVHPVDPAAGPLSRPVQALAATAAGSWLLQLLPAPWVRGVDFQKWQSEQPYESYFAGRYGGGHPAYYLVAFALKLPLALLALLLLGLCRGPPWPPGLTVLFAAALVIPVGYPSFFSDLQGGIRYVLAVMPLLAILAGRGVAALLAADPPVFRAGPVLAAGLLFCAVWPQVPGFPHYTSQFNVLAGGRPYLWFIDSSLDWPAGDLRTEELQRVQASWPGFHRLPGGQGPTLGSHLVYGPHLAQPDPRNPPHARHWLWSVAPVAAEGAWFVFQVDEPTLQSAVSAARDPGEAARRAIEAGVALALGGDPGAAHPFLERGVNDPLASELRVLLTRDPTDPAYRHALSAVQRHDLVAGDKAQPLAIRAKALAALGRFRDANDLFAASEEERVLTAEEVLLWVLALRKEDRIEDALMLLRRHRPEQGRPEQELFDRLLVEFSALQEVRKPPR